MKVNYCIFSWRFNFMGEPCLKTLPPNPRGDIHLIHNGKTEEHAARMNTHNKVDRVWFEPDEMYHGGLLDRIMRLRRYPEITDCDWLMIVDQDICILDQEIFTRHINEFCGMMTIPEALLVVNREVYGEYGFRFLFRTMPFFAIRVTDEWNNYPSTWDREIISESEKYDSVQRLAHMIDPSRIHGRRIREDAFLKHLSSLWWWLTPDRGIQMYRQINNFYTDVIGTKRYWEIPDYELDMANKFPLLQESVRLHRQAALRSFDHL